MRVAVALASALASGVAGEAIAQNMGWSTVTPSITSVDPLDKVLRVQRQQQQRAGSAASAPAGRPTASTFCRLSKAIGRSPK
jgi:hypothetical protein